MNQVKLMVEADDYHTGLLTERNRLYYLTADVRYKVSGQIDGFLNTSTPPTLS